MDEKYLNLTEADEESMIQREFDALLQDYAATRHTQKTEIIKRAFDFAKSAHHGVRRRSGEPYIMHPLAVARIVVKEIGLGSTSICSALLHDVVEDTDYTVEDIEERFGPKIAQIVSGLTKISGGIFGEKASEQAENFRRLILTMPEDVRVILIKMADRLHNMRTLGSMPPAKQLKISGETQYIYAPLAARLGFFLIKTELENLSFKYEQPSVYAKIQEQVDAVTPQLEESYLRFIGPIKQILDSYNYKYTITYRVKSPYSIFRKMQNKHIPFDEVYDLLAVRIILKPRPDEDERANCWVTYSALTSLAQLAEHTQTKRLRSTARYTDEPRRQLGGSANSHRTHERNSRTWLGRPLEIQNRHQRIVQPRLVVQIAERYARHGRLRQCRRVYGYVPLKPLCQRNLCVHAQRRHQKNARQIDSLGFCLCLA